MKNIVLLVADTLRDKDLEQRGKEIAPFLTDMEEENIKIENYYSNASWTAPAHATLFTGKLPSSHGTTTENPFFEKENKLTQTVKEHGYEAIGLSENEWVSGFSGLDRGFDEFKHYSIAEKGGKVWKKTWKKDSEFKEMEKGWIKKWSYFFRKLVARKDVESASTFLRHIKTKISRKIGVKNEADYNPRFDNLMIQQASTILEQSSGKFVFMNIMPVHAKYSFNKQNKKVFLPDVDDPEISDITGKYPLAEYLMDEKKTEEFLNTRENAYLASINYTDNQIKKLYQDAPDNTTFIVIGDHGELTGEYKFNERPLIHHHLGTFKELIDVPCYIFSKKGISIETDSEQIYDHRDMTEIIESIITGENPEGREYTNSEYYGLKGLAQFRDKEIPGEIEHIHSRKSFSVLNKRIKYDLTSDGRFSWSMKELSEETSRNTDSGLKDKSEILYSHHFE